MPDCRQCSGVAWEDIDRSACDESLAGVWNSITTGLQRSWIPHDNWLVVGGHVMCVPSGLITS